LFLSGSRYFGRFIRKYSKNVQDQVESQVIVEETMQGISVVKARK
jgi:hypothetical protein